MGRGKGEDNRMKREGKTEKRGERKGKKKREKGEGKSRETEMV